MMLKEADGLGLRIVVISGYRQPEIQEFLYQRYRKVFGRKALDIIARSGHSEHQLGTAVDLDSWQNFTRLGKRFESTPEGRWLLENSWKYGFILSYPKGKKKITGYDYEPWHYRYVGKEHAKKIKEMDITLIEYLESLYQENF